MYQSIPSSRLSVHGTKWNTNIFTTSWMSMIGSYVYMYEATGFSLCGSELHWGYKAWNENSDIAVTLSSERCLTQAIDLDRLEDFQRRGFLQCFSPLEKGRRHEQIRISRVTGFQKQPSYSTMRPWKNCSVRMRLHEDKLSNIFVERICWVQQF